MEKNNSQFNIVITGVGGQGLISLAQIISQAALDSGLDVKTSELHGLSQREGSVKVEVRFGKKVWSPLVMPGKADLVFALECQEALNALYYSSPKTVFLINDFSVPTLGKSVSQKQVIQILKKFSKSAELIPANKICQEKLGKSVTAGVFLLAYAVYKKLIPLKESSFISAVKTLPEKYQEINLKTLELARQYGKI